MYLLKAAKLVLLLVLCFSTLPVQGEVMRDRPLIAELSVSTETFCSGAETRNPAATISFTNRSERNILLKMSGGQNVTEMGIFSTRTLRPLLFSWMSMSDQVANGSSADLVLRPGETINYELRFKLTREVLTEPGFYKLQVSYNAASLAATRTPLDDLSGKTNWVIVQVDKCGDR